MPASTADQNRGVTGDVATILNMDDADFAREFGLTSGADSPPEPAADVADQATTTDEPAEEPEVEAAPDAEADTEADTVAPAEEAEATPEDAPKVPLTAFSLLGKDGKPVAETPELLFSFKANGKMQERVPLDKVVRLAQSGFHNEQLTQETDRLRAELPVLQRQAEEMAQRLADQQALAVRLLEDEEFLARARDQYSEAASPENRAARAEARVARVEEERRLEVLQRDGMQFIQSQVGPRLEALLQEFSTVPSEEAYGKFVLLLSPLQRGGVVPKRDWSRVVEIVDNEIAPWMSKLHEHRAATTVKTEIKQQAKVTKAQEEATKAKRQLARAMSPSAKSGAKLGAPKSKAPRDTNEAMDQILEEALAGLV